MAESKQPAMLIKIQALMDTMSKSEKLVCEYIIAHPKDVIHLSVSGLAAASGVSDATVIRASQKIGNGSYQDLKISLAQDIVSPLEAINEDVRDNDSPALVLEKVFQSTLHTISLTYKMLNTSDIKLAADKLLSAKRISICGLGNSHTIAMDLQHKLMRLGLNVTAHWDSHLQIIGATFIGEEDVLVAISHSGSSKDIVKAAQIARENGAFVISLTALGNSPLTEVSDLSLFTASSETQYRAVALSSRAASLTIVDALYTLIALQKGNAAAGFYKLEANLSDTKF